MQKNILGCILIGITMPVCLWTNILHAVWRMKGHVGQTLIELNHKPIKGPSKIGYPDCKANIQYIKDDDTKTKALMLIDN